MVLVVVWPWRRFMADVGTFDCTHYQIIMIVMEITSEWVQMMMVVKMTPLTID